MEGKMRSMYFDFKDIFKSNRIAFSVQRIWIQFAGMAAAYLIYLVFTYASLMTAGKGFAEMWRQMGLFPCLARVEANWYSWIIFIAGVLLLVLFYMVTSTAVSRAAYMLLKGNTFYTWRESFRFSFRKMVSVIMSPVAIAVLIALLVLGGVVVGLLAKIPFVGELGLSLFMPLWIVGGLLIVFFAIVLIVALVYTPSVIATTDDDAFEAVFQSFSTFWSQPWRMILYQALSLALSVAGIVVFAFLVKRAFLVVDAIAASIIGDKYMNLMGHGMYVLSDWIASFTDWLNSVCGENLSKFYFGREFLQLKLPAILNVSSHIFAMMMLIIGGWVLSYGFANFNVATTLSYLVLRKKKENDNLLERVDKEEEEEDDQEEVQEKTEEKS